MNLLKQIFTFQNIIAWFVINLMVLGFLGSWAFINVRILGNDLAIEAYDTSPRRK